MDTRGSRTEAAIEYIREEKRRYRACSALIRRKITVLDKLEKKIERYGREPEKFRFFEAV